MYWKDDEKGIKRGFFTDLNGQECCIQDSSLATDSAIRFGVNDSKMHLTKDMVKALLPHLHNFVKEGELK